MFLFQSNYTESTRGTNATIFLFKPYPILLVENTQCNLEIIQYNWQQRLIFLQKKKDFGNFPFFDFFKISTAETQVYSE
jgi:hypothetical protein